MTPYLYSLTFTRLSGLALGLGAVALGIWLDKRFNTHIMDRRPWLLPVMMIAVLIILIASILIYRSATRT
jgi:hypothetical protein